MLDPSAGIQWDFNMVNLRTTNGGIMKSAVKLKKNGLFFSSSRLKRPSNAKKSLVEEHRLVVHR